jgi:hypothetical protein
MGTAFTAPDVGQYYKSFFFPQNFWTTSWTTFKWSSSEADTYNSDVSNQYSAHADADFGIFECM